jgi:hypothetical protein
VFDNIRSGWRQHYGYNNINDCITFLKGPYPNLLILALIELRELKYKRLNKATLNDSIIFLLLKRKKISVIYIFCGISILLWGSELKGGRFVFTPT